MKKRILISVVSMMVVFTMIPLTSSAQVPKTINYQGYLTDTAGNPVSGAVSMTYSIYDAAAGGSALWSENRTVTVDNGKYSVNLGAVNPISLSEARPYYLGVQVGSDPEMTPRKELTSAMYSLFVDGITVKNGDVGIGTTDPEARLDIRGGGLHIEYSNPMITLRDPSEDGNTDINRQYSIMVGRQKFKILDDDAGRAPRLTIDKDGNVGIGALDPNRLLHLSSPGPSIKIENTQSGNVWEIINGGSFPDVLRFIAPGKGDHFAIDHNTGNVGIGIANPNRLLHLRSTNPEIRIENSQSGKSWQIINGGSLPNVLRFAASGKGEHFVIDHTTGNVGIGTVKPDSKLTVAGRIHAREVKVTTNAGADFVFEEGYKLQNLPEVEKYVKTNKHLPDIPSALEMQENGVDIGEFQIKLLQKVEELTLHLIELEKENTRLQKRISVLESLSE